MTYNLNLIPGKVPVAVHVKQYDTGLREITFNLYHGDTAYSVPYNSTITVSGTKPDGNGFSYSVTFSGSAVSVPMQEQMTVLAGDFPCQLTIANSGEIIGTASFLLCVEPAALSSDTPVSDTDLAMFQQLANQTQTEAAGVANATAQIAANTQNIATNTAAIEQLNSDVTALSGKWVVETVTGITVPSTVGGNTNWASGSVAKSGYTPVGVVGYYFTGGTANTWLFPYSMRVSGNSVSVAFRNLADSSITASGNSLTLDVLYQKA